MCLIFWKESHGFHSQLDNPPMRPIMEEMLWKELLKCSVFGEHSKAWERMVRPQRPPLQGLGCGVVIKGHASYSRASPKGAVTTPWASSARARLAVILQRPLVERSIIGSFELRHHVWSPHERKNLFPLVSSPSFWQCIWPYGQYRTPWPCWGLG